MSFRDQMFLQLQTGHLLTGATRLLEFMLHKSQTAAAFPHVP